MLHDIRLGVEFFAWLAELDRRLARWVAAGRCHYCDGRLHQGNYCRKPRGAKVAGAAEGSTVRYSLCCNREGCRRRTLPPSLRFLGRRVYAEAVVLIASVVALLLGGTGPASEATAVPARTLKRWATWWREIFPQSQTWQEVRALMVPSPAEALLPRSLYERIDQELARGGSARSPGDVCVTAARLLASYTTLSLPDASRFVGMLSLGQAPELVTQKMA